MLLRSGEHTSPKFVVAKGSKSLSPSTQLRKGEEKIGVGKELVVDQAEHDQWLRVVEAGQMLSVLGFPPWTWGTAYRV